MQESGEMYLETILLLQQKNDYVHAVDIANEMSFSKPSVSRALSLLHNDNLIIIDKNSHIALTEKGRSIAVKILKRHQLLKNTLAFLGVNEKTAEQDACRIEHYISDETYKAIKKWSDIKKEGQIMETANVYQSDNLKIKSIVLGLLSNNVYVVESDGEIAIVDPSCRHKDIIEFAGTKEISKILATHYHFDHVGAAKDLKEETNAKVYASKTDAKFIENPNDIPVFHRKVDACNVDVKLKEGDIVTIGNSEWKVIETPGHTMGGICFYNETAQDHPILICGDTLFKRSCGRTDFEDSKPELMRQSLAKLAKLPDNTLVLPGHDRTTTIEHERHYMLAGL